jgi:hypothetical protein
VRLQGVDILVPHQHYYFVDMQVDTFHPLLPGQTVKDRSHRYGKLNTIFGKSPGLMASSRTWELKLPVAVEA